MGYAYYTDPIDIFQTNRYYMDNTNHNNSISHNPKFSIQKVCTTSEHWSHYTIIIVH